MNTREDHDEGLLCAFVLDGNGGGRPLIWADIDRWRPEDGVLWIHLDRMHPRAQHWLRVAGDLTPAVHEALTADETRPRSVRIGDALLVLLRGVNLNPGADPEDMVQIRLWIDEHRIISVRNRRLMAVNDIRERLLTGEGPKGASAFLVELTDGLIDRMGPVIDDLDALADRVSTLLTADRGGEARTELTNIRQTAISLRRYLAPQRDAMSRLHAEQVTWIGDLDRAFLREIADRTTRYVEDLEAIRERAIVAQEELSNRLAEQTNRTMYLLTLVASVLLPPSLLTGLLGINVGGMPGVDSQIAFSVVVVVIIGIAIAELILLRRLRWI